MFAENGRGKTTLCAILRSLFLNNPAFILGRATLGSPDAPEVQLLFAGGGNIAFRAGAWNSVFPHIAVFDGTYVSENVFAGDVVDTEHRRNLYRVIIGAQGVALATQVTQLDSDINAKNRELRDARAALQRHLAPGMNVEAFLVLPEDADIDAKIASKEQELLGVQRSAQLQLRSALALINVPAFPAGFAALLGKTFAVMAADAERKVAEHIAKHQMQARGEAWLTEGLRYATGDTCPFCAQSLAGVDLLEAYRAFFSRDYHALRDEVNGMGRQIDETFGERLAAGIEQTITQNDNHAEFWQQYCELTPPALQEAGRVGAVIDGLRQAARALLQAKAASPLDAVPPGEEFTRALEGFEALRASIASYNQAVATANATITAKKREAQAADARAVEAALARLRAQKARHSGDVPAQCAGEAALQQQKQRLEEEKTRAKDGLDAHTGQVIRQYGESINRFLSKINAGFRITTPTHTYRGGSPSTSYQIVINQNAVDLGDPDTPHDRPSFKNTLSAGDRNTLALAFFLAQLEQDAHRAERIVVFDDPFTSLDSFRRNHTVHQIHRCGESCAQVVVLSHDPGFLKLLWDRVPPADRKTLQLVRVGEENTAIAEWDIEKAVMARYRAQLDDLQRFYSDNEGELRDIIQKLRPILEGYCRNVYPAHFIDQDTLGVIVGKIRDAGAAHPLFPIGDDLDELNIYCRRYHHGENPDAATEPIDDAELQGYVKRTLSLVGCLL